MANYRAALTGTLAVVLISLLLHGCRYRLSLPDQPDTVTTQGPHEMLNATLWQQGSAEYAGVVHQVWLLAYESLEKALADPQWSAALEQQEEYSHLPPAIVLDLDETVLDNTVYEAQIITRHGQYSQASFAEWCHDNDAPAVSGAKNFLDFAADRGVAIFYYSARREKLRDCTLRNMRALNLPLPNESRLFLSNGMTKTERRARIAQYYRILLLFGDNLDDFVADTRSDPVSRRRIALRHRYRWGREWIILPNPMYGHWESSMYGFDYSVPREEQLRRKLQELQD